MKWLERFQKKNRKPVGRAESPTDVTGDSAAGPGPARGNPGQIPRDIPELVERFPLRSGPYVTLLPPMTDDLVRAQRAGAFLATEIVRGYADRLYTTVQEAVGGDVPPAPRHGLVVRAGRLTSVDDPAQPAVQLEEEGFGNLAMLSRLDERGINPHLHLAAATRVLSGARSIEETGAGADLPDLLDQAWFLLAFWLSISLGNGRMLDEERRLIVHLVGCCSRLHVLSEAADPPPFVTDAIDSDLVVRHFDERWVTTAHVRMPNGEVQDEGHFSTSDSGRPLRVGALLRAQLHRDASPADPAAAFALGLLKAEADDLADARAALDSACAHPDWSEAATQSLRDLRPEEASLELLMIFTDWGIETRRSRPPDPGSPARARVVEIGERLHEAGGTSLMRQAHEAFGRRTDRTESSWLEIIWSGVGDWQS
ncbi:hypothetical protein [Actinomadura sp. 6N118]|uniref:hypothetical protein n=1 Tax=Actinomadura sp. 6N118 TaxID=3375151 RepID=UPI00379DDC00